MPTDTTLSDLLARIRDGFAAASPLDQLNLALGVIGVWLMIRRRLAAFPVGMVAVAVQGLLFFRARFYADAALQVFFFVTLAWGWWHWVKDRGAAPELPVTTLSPRGRWRCAALVLIATVAWAVVLQHWTDAIMPWRDALIAMLQVAGQVLQARKQLECWALFTAANLVAIPAYWSAELAYTACLFAVYLVLGLAGWWSWWKARRA